MLGRKGRMLQCEEGKEESFDERGRKGSKLEMNGRRFNVIYVKKKLQYEEESFKGGKEDNCIERKERKKVAKFERKIDNSNVRQEMKNTAMWVRTGRHL